MKKFDINTMTPDKTPSRWVMSATRLKEVKPEELAKLNDNEREIFNRLYESDWGTSRPAYTTASVVSADASNIVFAISSADDDVPVTFDYSVASGLYGSNPVAPTSADTDLTLTNGQWTYSSSAAGSQFKFAFAATDSDGVEGPLKSVEVIIAPAVPTGLAVDTSGVVTFTGSDGAASHSIEYVINGGDPVVVVEASGYTIPGVVTDDVVDVRVLATNPGGSSDYSSVVSQTIA